MKQLIIITALLALSTTTNAEAAKGQQLHDQNCMKCHGTEVYTRENRMVTSRDALVKQVKRCQLNLGVQWFNEDVNAVVQYLDQTFYKFGK